MVDNVQAIKNLIFSYAELLDSGDIEGLARLFAHGTIRTGTGQEHRGPRPFAR